MKKVLATLGLFALLAIPTTMANAACCCNAPAPCCSNPCCAPAPCDVCSSCKIQCVTIPKKHFWNLKRKGYYTVCPCETGGAAPVCPTTIGACVADSVPSKMVTIPKKFFWEKERCQRMPISNGCNCCQPANDCGCGCK